MQQQQSPEQQISQLAQQNNALKIRIFDAEETAGSMQSQLQQNGIMMGKLFEWMRANIDQETRMQMKEALPFLGNAVDDMPVEAPVEAQDPVKSPEPVRATQKKTERIHK